MADRAPVPHATVHVHPAVERMQMRRRMVAAIDHLLDVVDALVRESDDFAPDPDLEPSLGAAEYADNLSRLPRSYDEAFLWTKGAQDDREADGDRWTAKDADFEPSLGATFKMDQRRWVKGPSDDLEQEHDGRERECEDEGAQCDDEGHDSDREADHDHRVHSYLLHDQTRLGTYSGDPLTPMDPDEDLCGLFVDRFETSLDHARRP